MTSPLNLLQIMRLRDIRVTDHMTGAEKRDLLDLGTDYRAFRRRISSTGAGQSLDGMDFSLAAKNQRQHLPIFWVPWMCTEGSREVVQFEIYQKPSIKN